MNWNKLFKYFNLVFDQNNYWTNCIYSCEDLWKNTVCFPFSRAALNWRPIRTYWPQRIPIPQVKESNFEEWASEWASRIENYWQKLANTECRVPSADENENGMRWCLMLRLVAISSANLKFSNRLTLGELASFPPKDNNCAVSLALCYL